MNRGSQLDCEFCDEEITGYLSRFLASIRRIYILNGPNGESLCRKHHHDAWAEEMGVGDER